MTRVDGFIKGCAPTSAHCLRVASSLQKGDDDCARTAGGCGMEIGTLRARVRSCRIRVLEASAKLVAMSIALTKLPQGEQRGSGDPRWTSGGFRVSVHAKERCCGRGFNISSLGWQAWHVDSDWNGRCHVQAIVGSAG